MCGRYYIDDGRDSVELRQIIESVNRRDAGAPVKTAGEIFPTDVAPVVAGGGPDGARAMQWGYALPGGRRVINARSETAHERPMFRGDLLQRRCAVPATCYFEWQRARGRKTKYAIRPGDGDLFYMAGIYRLQAGQPVFCILTRDPAERIAFIHDRMPVILPRDLMRDWVDPRFDAGDLLKHAVLDVSCANAEDAEQLAMPF
ncbi:MAG: SOS response-associated peptidase [Clostridia bacterium]|nr:SOS response-associated peptidase [Clostridia bacterium]